MNSKLIYCVNADFILIVISRLTALPLHLVYFISFFIFLHGRLNIKTKSRCVISMFTILFFDSQFQFMHARKKTSPKIT